MSRYVYAQICHTHLKTEVLILVTLYTAVLNDHKIEVMPYAVLDCSYYVALYDML